MKKDLENLHQLFPLNIPSIEEVEDGFLEIIGKSHHENIISNFYAYFLSRGNHPKIASLFLNSLLEIIKHKSEKELTLSNYKVHTEVRTENGKRIDIAIVDNKNSSSIIIENKIYHILNNDLDEYWNHFSCNEENKIGVVLTLTPTYIEHEFSDKYINITHKEWIDRILTKRMPFQAWSKSQVYLTDFFQTINNLSKSTYMNELSKFYFEHIQIIESAVKAKEEGESFLLEQQKILAVKLNLSNSSEDPLYYSNFWDAENELETFYTVTFDKLLEGKRQITIIIELEGDDIKKIPELQEKLKDDKDFNSFNCKPNFHDEYVHFLHKEYSLTMNDIEKLADFIYGKINADFKDIMEKILTIVKG